MQTDFFEIVPGVKCLELKHGLSSNVYFLEHDDSLLLIDSGSSLLTETLKQRIAGKNADKVLITHGHFDHVGNAGLFPGKAFLHEEDVKNLDELSSIVPGFTPPKLEVLKMEKINFGPFSIQPVHVPGHTPGSTAFLEENFKLLFSGDTMFAHGGVGRTDFPLGNEQQLRESLDKIIELDYEYICAGHGDVQKIDFSLKK